MKIGLWSVMVGLMAVGLIGCSGGAPEEERVVNVTPEVATMAPVEGQLKVALLTPGPVSDSGWNAMANEGLMAIETELDAVVSHQEATDAGIKDAMRGYAQDGYHLVIGHGFEYNEPGVEVSNDFKETAFVSSSGGEMTGNAGAFRFYLEQGFYLCGYMAGKMTKTNTVAMVGGPDVPSIRSTFMAFKAGAEDANSDVTVLEKFTGKESDVAAAKQLTLQMISEGADMVIHQTNAAARGVFEACEEKGVSAFGANLNQNEESESILASAIIVAKPAFVELARQIKAGEYSGSIQLQGMEEGAIDFKVNPKRAGDVPSRVRQEIDALTLAIISGDLEIPKAEF